jgi:hypothetical protein
VSRALARLHVEMLALGLLNVQEKRVDDAAGGGPKAAFPTSAMGDLMCQGMLRWLVNREDPNPRKANRLLLKDVKRVVAWRWQGHGDARFKPRRGPAAVNA